MNIRITKVQVDKILETLQTYVIPFEHPSKTSRKTFRKIKKLKSPLISDEILLESTYIGWNDIASNRKFIIYYNEQGTLTGFMATLLTKPLRAIAQFVIKNLMSLYLCVKHVLLVMDNIPKR